MNENVERQVPRNVCWSWNSPVRMILDDDYDDKIIIFC
jgi:hypothetical protein